MLPECQMSKQGVYVRRKRAPRLFTLELILNLNSSPVSATPIVT